MKLPVRTGFGYDVHSLEFNRRLMLGGIEVPFEKGLMGHSDADALLHAICDALLGALALGDIGKHFPDTDPEYKGADSKKLLSAVYKLIEAEGYLVGNIDATIVMQRPKLRPYIDAMRESIATLLNIETSRVSVKATTSEQMGFVGREEGVAVYAVALLLLKQGDEETP